LWVTDDENKIPLMVESSIFVGSIRAQITKMEKLKNPVTSRIK
jgi:hypothetical protein